jgi:lysine biosynthesis protein LysW
MARCPECSAKLTIPNDIARWDRFFCEACKAELEVLSLRPLELEAVYGFEESGVLDDLDENGDDAEDLEDLEELDWDEDDDEDDDDDDDDDDDEW